MPTEWDKITAGDDERPKRVKFITHAPNYEFAIAYTDWRTNNVISPAEQAYLDYMYRLMCILWNQNGMQFIWGALIAFAKEHPTFEVWFNGMKLDSY